MPQPADLQGAHRAPSTVRMSKVQVDSTSQHTNVRGLGVD